MKSTTPTATATATPARPQRGFPLRSTLVLVVLLLAPTWAAAQQLTRLLPAETVAAVGTRNLEARAELFEPFVERFRELEVGAALEAVFGAATADGAGDGSAATPEAPMDALPEALQALEPLDLLGQEAWLALSLSSFNPLPSVTALARTTPAATQAFAEAIADTAADEGVQRFSESGVEFFLLPLEANDSPFSALAYAQVGDLLMLSTNPDTLRGVLRRFGGSESGGFGESATYTATLGSLPDGHFFTFLDLAAASAALSPLAQGFGVDALVTRLQNAFATAGVSASTVQLTPAGFSGVSVLAPDGSGEDPALYNLLTSDAAADPALLSLVPDSALSVAVGRRDLSAWWNYLNDLVGNLPELGITSLDELVAMVGLDLRTSLFAWVGDDNATITTGATAPVEPGVAPDNLLGEVVWVLEAADEAAARAGLQQLFVTIATTASAFTDPSGGAGAAAIDERSVAGVDVTRYAVADGLAVSVAVADGYAFIATSDAAMEGVLSARGEGVNLPRAMADLADEIPSGARSFSLADNRVGFESLAAQLSSQLQLAAGLAGSATLDFDAVTEASRAVEAYLDFVASRLGGSVSYSLLEDGRLVTRSTSQVDW